MAATPGMIKANNLGIFIGGVFISCTTDATIEISREVIEAICKDNDGAKEAIGGVLDWKMTAAGIWKFDATYGIGDMYDAILADTLLVAKWGYTSEVSGNFYLSGNARITSISAGTPVNQVATWNVNFQGSGLPTKTTIS